MGKRHSLGLRAYGAGSATRKIRRGIQPDVGGANFSNACYFETGVDLNGCAWVRSMTMNGIDSCAFGRLAEANVFIDGSANASVMDVRSASKQGSAGARP